MTKPDARNDAQNRPGLSAVGKQAEAGRNSVTPTGKSPEWLASLDAAFDACRIADDAVLSFHHHLRNGDAVLCAVLDAAARRGLKGLGIAASSIFPVHAPLVEHIRSGVVTRLWTGYMKGSVADAVSCGELPTVARLQSHGSRARALALGEIVVDVAFIGAPAADPAGNLTGAVGSAACGPLGYPQIDAAHAGKVVALVHEVHDAPLPRCEIDAADVDFAVRVDRIGDPAGIASGTTRIATDPVGLMIASRAAAVVAAAGHVRDGLSLQTGAGGSSLATASAVGDLMRKAGCQGSFLSGGICGPHVDLVRAGVFRKIWDVQCFDRAAVDSYASDPWHFAMSAARYASPLEPQSIASQLDVVILGASEVDRDFNINVTTAGNGRIIGGPGGHPDTAAGAKLAIATTRLTAGGYAKIVDRVGAITTPGADVDVLVTDLGISVNPRHAALERELRKGGVAIIPIETQVRMSAERAERGRVAPAGRVVAIVEDREGGVRDEIRATVT